MKFKRWMLFACVSMMSAAVISCGKQQEGRESPMPAARPSVSQPAPVAQTVGAAAWAERTALPGYKASATIDPVYLVKFLRAEVPARLSAGQVLVATVEISNHGKVVWRPHTTVGLAYHWFDSRGNVVVRDGVRTELPQPVGPGKDLTIQARLKAPERAGTYILCWDMVDQGVTWFRSRGGETLCLRVEVVPGG